MIQTLRCPACDAILTHPEIPAAQAVQCPRCARIFDPSLPNIEPTHMVGAPPAAQVLQVHAGTRAPDLDDALRPPSPLLRAGRWSSDQFAYFAMGMLALSILFSAMQFGLNVERGRALKHARLGPAQMQQHNEITWVASISHHAVFWPTAVIFLAWFYLIFREAATRRAWDLVDSPEHAVACFVVPIFNLWRPYCLMQEIWRATHQGVRTDLSSGKVVVLALLPLIWWGVFVAGALLFGLLLLIFLSGTKSQSDLLLFSQVACLAHVCLIVSGGILIFMIHTITRRQREREAL